MFETNAKVHLWPELNQVQDEGEARTKGANLSIVEQRRNAAEVPKL